MTSGYLDVETTAGTVRGVAAPGLASFLGIRYAVAPARFARPVPVPAWRGARSATWFGPGSPQVDSRVDIGPEFYQVQRLLHPGVPTPLEGGPSAEHCQYLNVWTPAVHGQRPVMVWLHGGGDTQGSGSEAWTQGDRLAVLGDVVVVTLNHRLGVLGYLGSANGSDCDSGLAGIFDVVEALRWVRDNVDRFGGDPTNVTVFGQSGGGGKICTLMAMPAATGLFHRVILQSGVKVRAVEPSQAAALRRDLDATLAANGTDVDRAPLEALIEAQRHVEARYGGRAVGPVLHTSDLPAHPFADGAPTSSAGLAMLVGTTRHDSALRLSMSAWYHHMQPQDLALRFGEHFPIAPTRELLEHYLDAESGQLPQLVLARACADAATRRARTDVVVAAKARQQAPVYLYRFDHQTNALGGILGAPHCLDVPLVFGNADRSPVTGTRPERFQVSTQLISAWIAFARSGRPASAELPEWPVYGTTQQQMIFDDEPRVELQAASPEVTCTISAGT